MVVTHGKPLGCFCYTKRVIDRVNAVQKRTCRNSHLYKMRRCHLWGSIRVQTTRRGPGEGCRRRQDRKGLSATFAARSCGSLPRDRVIT